MSQHPSFCPPLLLIHGIVLHLSEVAESFVEKVFFVGVGGIAESCFPHWKTKSDLLEPLSSFLGGVLLLDHFLLCVCWGVSISCPQLPQGRRERYTHRSFSTKTNAWGFLWQKHISLYFFFPLPSPTLTSIQLKNFFPFFS